MAAAHILRLPLTNNTGGHVLVRVVPSPAQGSRPLDLELTATDDEQAYIRTLQHSKISKYRDRNSALSEDEWEQCLTALLLPGALLAGNLDVTTQRRGESNLIINVEKRVSGHTEPVGSLTLTASEEATDAIDLFSWCNDAANVRSQLERELIELRRKHTVLESLVLEETEHFRELERAKKEFEADHDSFLKDLLNEKKIKIRTQGQILSTASVDEDKLAAVGDKGKAGKPEAASKRRGAASASRKGKRKAGGTATPDEETDEDAAADMMDIDPKPQSPERDLEEQELSDAGRTTEGSETASEPDAEPEPEPTKKAGRSSARKKGTGASSTPPARASKRKNGNPPSSNLRGKSPVVEPESEDDSVPPPRRLPFKNKAAPASAPADDESTASEASEL